jgi:predicted dithiol-disulfide oxidoreductase (DUF899 family)
MEVVRMPGFRFPNESDQYRTVRNELLEMEKELRAQVDAVAAKRRELPRGGKLDKAYEFENANGEGQVRKVGFGELFGDHSTLILYSMMFGRDWDAPCPSCTSIVDALDASYIPTSDQAAMAVVGAASATQLSELAASRNWRVPVYSDAGSGYLLEYFPYRETEDASLVSMMNVFTRDQEGIFHFWGSELVAHPKENGHPNHVDIVWPFWNLLDMTPKGRGDVCIPRQNYDHRYFTKNVFPGEE